ncbi:MAG: hypothetical protein HC945_04245 [Nitrosarchaeum sp.]|nr:hypothetical protein [Nitrosarchaeum sp.]
MSHAMPQEVEVWYLLPAIRRELVKIFTGKLGLTQKQAAGKLELTEAAVSQYLKKKRGAELEFTAAEKAGIERAAKEILVRPAEMLQIIYGLSRELRARVPCASYIASMTDPFRRIAPCVGQRRRLKYFCALGLAMDVLGAVQDLERALGVWSQDASSKDVTMARAAMCDLAKRVRGLSAAQLARVVADSARLKALEKAILTVRTCVDRRESPVRLAVAIRTMQTVVDVGARSGPR